MQVSLYNRFEMQSSILGFMGKHFIDPPLYFVCDWSNDYYPKYYFANNNDCLINGKIVCEMQWKLYDYKTTLRFVYIDNGGNDDGDDGNLHNFFEKSKTIQNNNSIVKNTSLLKSNLQKAVRRQKVDIALSSTKTLLHIDSVALLRRLPIIILEDVELHHKYFGIIVWLMGAHSKNFALLEKHTTFIYTIVKWMCNHATWDIPGKMFDLNLKKHLKKKFNIKEQVFNLTCALQVRLNYGGMKGDMHMIRYRIHNLLVKNENAVFKCDNYNNNYEKILFTTLSQVIPEAIDFHCFHFMLKALQSKHPQYSTNDIKSAIWYGGSRHNFRNDRKHKENENNPIDLQHYLDIYNHHIENDIKTLRNTILQKYCC